MNSKLTTPKRKQSKPGVLFPGYNEKRESVSIRKKDWNKIKPIEQGQLCKYYNIVFLTKTPSKLDSILMKFDPTKFKFEYITQGIEIINTNTERIGNAIDKFNNGIAKFSEAFGGIGIQDKKGSKKSGLDIGSVNLDVHNPKEEIE
jgi:hypothetical protein